MLTSFVAIKKGEDAAATAAEQQRSIGSAYAPVAGK
jgi:hypothetical protein